MNGLRRRAFCGGDLNAIGRCAGRAGRAAEPPLDGADDRPWQIAAERAQGQQRRRFLDGSRRAAGEILQRRLQLLLRGLQLAGELGVQVAAAVDVADEVAARLRRAIGRGLRALHVAAQRLELAMARVELRARFLHLVERVLMLGDAPAVELRQRRNGARRLTHRAQIGGREQQAQVAALSQFVDLNQPRAKARTLGQVALLELAHAVAGAREFGGDALQQRVDLLVLLRFDLPLDFELAQIADERLLLGREQIRFALQRLQPLGRAARERLGPRALRLLCEEGERQHHGDGHDNGRSAGL